MHASEDELITAIGKVLSGAGPEVLVGPGDDAAVLRAAAGQHVLTADVLVERVHFERAFTSARDLGYKAIVVNVSDIAAMAASPRAAVVTLTLSSDVDEAWVMELYGGMREACDEYALWLVGGDLSRGSEIAISVAALGEVAPGRAVLRSGAREGDIVVVTGTLGASAAGRRMAEEGRRPAGEGERALLRAHFRPVARVGEAAVLARHGATSMIDVSDGLGVDLSRVCAASGVGVRLRLPDVPVAVGATSEDALGGGEDYELLATLPGSPEAVRRELRESFGVDLTEIGGVTAGELEAVDEAGATRALRPVGWRHFG